MYSLTFHARGIISASSSSPDVTNVIVWGNISGSFYADLQKAKVFNYDGAIKGPAFFSQPVRKILHDRFVTTCKSASNPWFKRYLIACILLVNCTHWELWQAKQTKHDKVWRLQSNYRTLPSVWLCTKHLTQRSQAPRASNILLFLFQEMAGNRLSRLGMPSARSCGFKELQSSWHVGRQRDPDGP